MDLRDDYIYFDISDNGIGMEAAMVERVFDLFSQAERTADRSQGGLGIGLALVKSLVELHQGEVSAKSAGLGQGSQFRISLPKAGQASNGLLEVDTNGHVNICRKLRLIVVDDNQDAATMLAMFLEGSGHDVFVEHDAQHFLEKVSSLSADVCLLDIGLPDIDGNELARRLRANPATHHIKLIAITGYGQAQDRQQSKTAGFDYYFVKPVNTSLLLQTLNDIQKQLDGSSIGH
jgi:CheY-like chemotaxis protein